MYDNNSYIYDLGGESGRIEQDYEVNFPVASRVDDSSYWNPLFIITIILVVIIFIILIVGIVIILVRGKNDNSGVVPLESTLTKQMNFQTVPSKSVPSKSLRSELLRSESLRSKSVPSKQTTCLPCQKGNVNQNSKNQRKKLSCNIRPSYKNIIDDYDPISRSFNEFSTSSIPSLPTSIPIVNQRKIEIKEESFDEHDFISDLPVNELTTSPAIDACEYGSANLFLLENNLIRFNQDNNTWYKKSNIKLQKIISFNGYLYSVSEGKLHMLRDNMIRNNFWYWDPVLWFTSSVDHISTSYDEDLLYIKSGRETYLYNKNLSLIKKLEEDGYRKYGRTKDSYLVLHDNHVVLFPQNVKFNLEKSYVSIDSKNQIKFSDSDLRFLNGKLTSIN